MGIGIDLKGLGDIFSGAGSLAKDIRTAVTGDISPEKKAELEAKALEIEATVLKAQMEINAKEAESTSLFVSGWRPALGWIGALAFGLQFLVRPLAGWAWQLVTGTDPQLPAFDTAELWPMLAGILGLGTLRTVEKAQGVARK
jgi:hypothetical protein